MKNNDILLFISGYLKKVHQQDNIYWEKFLAPFMNSFLSYYGSVKLKNNNDENIDELIIPYGNNDFIASLEAETYHYKLLKNRKIYNRKSIHIATPSGKYIDKYIFPYSNKSKIAFLSFPTKVEKIIFYTISLLDINSCKFDYLQENPALNYSHTREQLLEELLKRYGNEKKDMFEVLVFSIPSIYIENFSFYYEKANVEAKKLKKIKSIFFLRHVFFNPTFLILLSLKSINKKQLITYQHGGVYGQTNPNWSEKTEKILSTNFLTWGYKYKHGDIPFISLRFKKYFLPRLNFFEYRKSILIILPLLFREEQIVSLENSFKILASILKEKEKIHIRFDPRERNQDTFFTILNSLNIDYTINKDTKALPRVASQYKMIIFITPNATGYLELINMHFYPLMVFHEKDFKIRKESLEIYQEMKKNNIWIDYDNVKSADISKIGSQQKKAIKKFKNRFIKTSFFPAIKLNYLLLKSTFRDFK